MYQQTIALSSKRLSAPIFTLFLQIICNFIPLSAYALDGGISRLNAYNGWRTFEIITIGDDPSQDGFDWSMPGVFDGLGAWLPNTSTLRIQISHELRGDATISEVNLDLASFQIAINSMIRDGNTNNLSFVRSARQAYHRWSNDGGITWTNTTDTTNTNFWRFCSGQSYTGNTFGEDRGFADDIYITGEESGTNTNFQRLFGLDLNNRDLYQLSGVSGSAIGGIGGMPFDSWENAALLDTGETEHIALLLSPDGGSQNMQIYIGEKGRDTLGNPSNEFLARNGLAYGSYYYLKGIFPNNGTSNDGTFDTTTAEALNSSKLEDIDTSPSHPTQVVLGDQNSGLFTFNFSFDFSEGNFVSAGSGYSITKIQDSVRDTDNVFGEPDNVDWTEATILNGVTYSEGLILVNEDTDTKNGEIWVMEPDGSGLTKIGDTANITDSRETSGILDISRMVGYNAGSIILTNNQGDNASLSALINPNATHTGDYDFDDDVDGQDFLQWQTGNSLNAHSLTDLNDWQNNFGFTANSTAVNSSAIPEPATWVISLLGLSMVIISRCQICENL